MLLTVPVVKEVVTVVNKADCGTPKRTSFPSILPIGWDIPSFVTSVLPNVSKFMVVITNVIKTIVVTSVTSVTGCFLARKKNILSFRNKN